MNGEWLPNGATVALTNAALLAKAVVGLVLESKDLQTIADDLKETKKATVSDKKKLMLAPLHDHLLLIASPRDMSKNDMVNVWRNATNADDVSAAIDKVCFLVAG